MAVDKDDAVEVAATPAVRPSINTPSPGMFTRIKRYLREVTAELKKTNWPSRDELTKSTIVVVLTIVVVAVLLYACDFVAGHFMEYVRIVPPQAGR